MTDQIPILQVVDKDLAFCQHMRNFCHEHSFDSCETYFVVAVLGCQSTGKSTLLNLLFGTEFEVMNSSRGRNQTTLGVWMGITGTKRKVLVFDVEGTDSKERGEQHTIFERKTALFSLALSEVLILNLMTTDVGRFEGSNYGLLKTVFDLNLQLFTKEVGGPKTLLLFVLRDHDPEDTPLEALKQTLMTDMVKLWNDIKKPPNFVASTVHDFFEFQFVSLPHFKYQKEKWQSDVLCLKERFLGDSSRVDFLLKPEYRTGVPSDGFSTFAESIWNTIQSEKDLDLPSQRQMLAVFRCDEITAEALSTVKELQISLTSSIITNSTIVEDFGSTSKNALDKALEHFDSRTTRYERKVVDQRRQKLTEQLLAEFNPLWKSLLLLILTESKRFLHQHLQTEFADKKNPRMDFSAVSASIRNSTMEFFSKRASQSVIYPEQDPEDKSWKSERDDLSTEIERELKKARDEQLKLFLDIEKEKIINQFRRGFSQVLEESRENMWETARDIYEKEMKGLKGEFDHVLAEFGLASEEMSHFQEEFTAMCLSFVRSLFETKAKDISQNLTSVFASSFQLDHGVPRKWGKNDEAKVSKTFKSSLAKAEKLLDLYSILRLDPKYATATFYHYSPKRGLELSRDLSLQEKDPEMANCTLISSREGKRILETFRDQSTTLYKAALDDVDKAKRAAEIPYYVIIIALILGTNEIWWFLSMAMSSPTFLFLVLLLGGAGYGIWMMDIWPEIERQYGPRVFETIELVQNKLAPFSGGLIPPATGNSNPTTTTTPTSGKSEGKSKTTTTTSRPTDTPTPLPDETGTTK